MVRGMKESAFSVAVSSLIGFYNRLLLVSGLVFLRCGLGFFELLPVDRVHGAQYKEFGLCCGLGSLVTIHVGELR